MYVIRWVARVFAGVALLGLFLLGARFASLNTQVVDIHYLFGSGSTNLAGALLAAFVIGMCTGYFGSVASAWRQRGRARRALRDRQKLQQEVDRLRTLPVRDVG